MPIISVTRCANRNQPTALSYTNAMSGTAGKGVDCIFTFPASDDHSYIIVNNSGSKAITAKMSDGESCTGTTNKAYSIAAGKTAVIPVESGRCMTKSGNICLIVAPADSTATLSECQVSVTGFVSGCPTA